MTAGPDGQDAAATGGRGHIRASRADREHVADLLKTAFAQGRLSKDEFEQRLGQTLAARGYGAIPRTVRAATGQIPGAAWPTGWMVTVLKPMK